MARVAVTPVTASTAGAVCTPVAFTADGISVPNDGKTAVIVNNGAGASVDITTQFGDRALVDGVAPDDRVKAVAPSVPQVFGPWGSEYDQGGADGRVVWLDISAHATVTYQVIRVNPR
ncbi:hypothetical protein OG884_26535 [Streptosporangium sp. NBC_01755]|uniref:hypothetical protein n=1 Tax=Streptosporangium sp. NBC_01755 TaxID=2975949 RepID=UPI002DDB3E31|nr:hypothetical protein [Streptosporangium sp. NBC_01755]WSC98407.1 hypothetical protein OG884_26535 [Streptosporangium sp. NBC_01755]